MWCLLHAVAVSIDCMLWQRFILKVGPVKVAGAGYRMKFEQMGQISFANTGLEAVSCPLKRGLEKDE